VVALFIVLALVPPDNLRCFTLGPGVALRIAEVASIRSAVRAWSGRPAKTIELPDASEAAPAGTLEVVTLLRGNCDYGEGDRLSIRKDGEGWRVVKKIDHEGWNKVGTYGR
jgi:hypothetical protein